MRIEIDKERIFDKVRSEVFYRGETRKESPAASKAQMSEDDRDVFEDLFEEAAAGVVGELMIWGYPVFNGAFEVCPPSSWPLITEELKRAIEVYMIHVIVNRWMYMLGIGAEDFSERDLRNIKVILTKREKPI